MSDPQQTPSDTPNDEREPVAPVIDDELSDEDLGDLAGGVPDSFGFPPKSDLSIPKPPSSFNG